MNAELYTLDGPDGLVKDCVLYKNSQPIPDGREKGGIWKMF